EALEGRLGDLESQARERDDRGAELEQSLKDALRATEALAERVSTIFWIACIGCGFALIGLIVSAVAMTRTIRWLPNPVILRPPGEDDRISPKHSSATKRELRMTS